MKLTTTETISNTYKKRGQWGFVWKKLKKSRTAMFGMCVLCVFLGLIIFADVIADYEGKALYQDFMNTRAEPSWEHPFGTDNFGRDMFARVVHGTRTSYAIGFGSVSIAAIIGVLLGGIAAYKGGIIDTLITRIMDAMMSVPNLLLALAVMAALGSGAFNLALAMVISKTPQFARLIRSSVLTINDQDYIKAAKACGTSDFRILTKHIIPNAIGPIIVQATMQVAAVILSAAGLSFIGVGVQPPTPEWGTLLAENREFLRTDMYLVIFPGLAIILSALSLNMLGDGLRDALDPKLKN